MGFWIIATVVIGVPTAWGLFLLLTPGSLPFLDEGNPLMGLLRIFRKLAGVMLLAMAAFGVSMITSDYEVPAETSVATNDIVVCSEKSPEGVPLKDVVDLIIRVGELNVAYEQKLFDGITAQSIDLDGYWSNVTPELILKQELSKHDFKLNPLEVPAANGQSAFEITKKISNE